MHLRFDRAFTGHEWKQNWLVEVDPEGKILTAQESSEYPSDTVRIPGIVIPGFINVHSHAFQRAMAGLTEFRLTAHDSFWTWREIMYRLVQKLTPEACYVIARQVFLEMLQAGYTTVGEFHYLHHDPQGKPYDDLATMVHPLLQAAEETGINLCILPVLYQRAGFHGGPLVPGQRRFVLDLEDFLTLVDECRRLTANRPGCSAGAAFHSLRAVHVDRIRECVETLRRQGEHLAFHMHVAEQLREVEECLSLYKVRPVELAVAHCPMDQDWTLIHATHAEPREVQMMLKAKTVVALCPTTEANLGDGIFPAVDFLSEGGLFAMGSDSQMSIDARSELRLLEYGQRLLHRRRALLSDSTRSAGRRLCETAWLGGARSLRMPIGQLAPGYLADFIVLDPDHPSLVGRDEDRWLDSLVFCEHGSPILEVYTRGVRRALLEPGERGPRPSADFVKTLASVTQSLAAE